MKKFALALAAALPLTLLTPAASAEAREPCQYKVYVSWTSHFARNNDLSGGCKQVGVQHKYWPRSASKPYYSLWVWSTKDSATTKPQSEIQAAYGGSK